jgi:hypothetical protein
VRRPAQPLKKGTNTEEFVLPMGPAGGRHDLKWRSCVARPVVRGLTLLERGAARAPGMELGVDHTRVNGPEGDGMEIAVPPGVALVGRIAASSAKICLCIMIGEPNRSRMRLIDPDMARS